MSPSHEVADVASLAKPTVRRGRYDKVGAFGRLQGSLKVFCRGRERVLRKEDFERIGL